MHNQIIFLAQFEINKHLLIYQRPQIALALRPLAILLVFKKIYSCLFILNCTRNHVITYAIISIYRADGSETVLTKHWTKFMRCSVTAHSIA